MLMIVAVLIETLDSQRLVAQFRTQEEGKPSTVTHGLGQKVLMISVRRGKLGNGERRGMANRAISYRRGKSHQKFSP